MARKLQIFSGGRGGEGFFFALGKKKVFALGKETPIFCLKFIFV